MRVENDRLSSRLPEEIISHILSLMPTKFAVRTSILSKRWRYRWMWVTNIDIDASTTPSVLDWTPESNNDLFSNLEFYAIQYELELDRFTKFVDRVLEFCKSSQVILFRLHLNKMVVSDSSVSKWIDKAVKLNVCELDVGVTPPVSSLISLSTCKTLTTLRIDNMCSSDLEGSCPVNLPCLKTLDIVVFNSPFVSAFKLIRGSPILECLFLEVKEFGNEDEEDFIFNIPTLKQLKLTLTCKELTLFRHKAILNVPSLEYLFVGGELCSFFVMENVASLVQASVSLKPLSFNPLMHLRFDHRWFALIKGLSGVESFSAENTGYFSFETLLSPACLWPVFSNMKHLELKGFCPLMLQFLESSQLNHLCIETVDKLFFKEQNPEEYGWIEPKLVPACLLTNLTTIRLSKCKGQKHDIKFLEYMLANAKVLKTVAITWEKLEIEEKELARLCAQLLAAPRASWYCEIHFLNSFSPSTRT